MAITVTDIMTTKLVTFKPEDNLFDVMSEFIQHAISGGPVLDKNGNLVGIISERDCLNVIMQTTFDDGPPATVADHMSRKVIALPEDATVIAAAETFMQFPIRRIPIVDRKKRILGQVSRRNVVQAVLEKGPDYRWTSPEDHAAHQGRMAGNVRRQRQVGPITNTNFTDRTA